MCEEQDVVEAMPWVFEIPEENYDKLVERIDKMCRRARKCKLPPPTLEVIWENEEKKSKRVPDTDLDPTGQLGMYTTIDVWMHYYYVVVTGQKPTIKDWEFVATIEHGDDAGNLIKGVPGAGSIPVKYRKAATVCDHCHKSRRRQETFILRHLKTGEYKQIGRNCLQDFFDGQDPASIAQYLQWLQEAEDSLRGGEDEDYMGGDHSWYRQSIPEVLKMTQAVIDCCGWLSRSKAQELENGSSATASLVMGQLTPFNFQSEYDKALAKKLVFKPEYDQMVEDALAWARGLDPETTEDYLYNLHVCSLAKTIKLDRLGLICSLMPAHRRFLEGEKARVEREAKPTSEYQGVKGERGLFKGLTIKYISEPSAGYMEFSSTRLVKFEDEKGNVFTHWCSTTPLGEVGETFDVVATVKDHTEYRPRTGLDRRAVKQTVLTRVKEWDGKPLKGGKKKKE